MIIIICVYMFVHVSSPSLKSATSSTIIVCSSLVLHKLHLFFFFSTSQQPLGRVRQMTLGRSKSYFITWYLACTLENVRVLI